MSEIYSVYKATLNDISSICTTVNYYYNKFDNKTGFIAGSRTNAQIGEKLSNYYIVKKNGAYIGHAQLSFSLPEEFDRLFFYSLKDKEFLLNNQSLYLEHIAIAPDSTGAGAGSALISGISDIFYNCVIFSSVIVKPYCNTCSLDFHLKNDFRKVAYYNNDIINGMKFESIYLMKNKTAV